jgi:alanine racemase
MKLASKTWIEISKSALTQNVRAFRRHVGTETEIMAVVKSNAYGYGLVETAKIADSAGAAWFGVDNVDEGIALRKAGLKKPILALGYTLNDRLADCVANDISFVIYNLEAVRFLKKVSRGKKARVHIKIETGTTRQGVSIQDLPKFVRELNKLSNVVIEGVSTHFANIEDTTDHAYAEMQLDHFEKALSVLASEGIDPKWKHTACSAAAVLFPETHFNLVRLGISMYGLWSSKETLAVANSRKNKLVLKPALTWKTVVAQIKTVPKGTPISYGLTERVSRDSKIAVLPIGYWDGYDRGLSGSGTVLIRGRRCKVLGRICMNMCMVDVTDVPGVRVEDEVVILGTQKKEVISAEDIASRIGSINYEVVTRINPLLPRVVRP